MTAACAFLRGSSSAVQCSGPWVGRTATDAEVVSVAQKANRGQCRLPLVWRCSATATKPRTRGGRERRFLCRRAITRSSRGGRSGNRLSRPEEDGLPGAAASADPVRVRYHTKQKQTDASQRRTDDGHFQCVIDSSHRNVHLNCLVCCRVICRNEIDLR